MKKMWAVMPAVLLAAAMCPWAQAAALEASELVPVGDTVGIEIKMKGVMVVECGEVETDGGSVSPAGDAGLLAGDIILELNGQATDSSAEFLTAAGDMDGSPVTLTVERSGRQLRFSVTPAKKPDGTYQLGLWLRDGVSGIGTVTFYDPASGTYGALGHGINDIESGSLMPVQSGCVLDATVVDIIPGAVGKPGELCGRFEKDDVLGTLDINSVCGIFGHFQSERCPSGEALPVADSGEVSLGAAKILSNVSGDEVREYNVEISRIYRDEGDLRSMMITVTDPELIAKTGGIVQGMSGSPIIQDGKLVGAVTHVLVNDPARGYGIFIENMLDAAG